MLKERRHLFHIVNFSMTPFLIGFYLFVFALQLAASFKKESFFFYFSDNQIIWFFFLCIFIYLPFFYFVNQWKTEIILESFFFHTLIVQEGLKKGFLLFLVSEVMLFVGFFWAFFYSGFISNYFVFGGNFPPTGIVIIEPYSIPLYNTIILIFSGVVVTWGHRSIILNKSKDVIFSLFGTILLGLLFLSLQIFEYYESYFNISDSIYSCSFFLLTGLHGMHVFLGCILLFNSLIYFCKRYCSISQHLMIIFSIWYWHFVDIIWILLYFTIYVNFSGSFLI